jgi:hypothetical protein
MRGKDEQQLDVFSYISPEQRVPQDHPLRSLRAMTDEALQHLQPRLTACTPRPDGPRLRRRSYCERSCCKRCTRCAANEC